MGIRRVNHGRGHSYTDTDTGLRIPGVTTITGDGVPKPALLKWAAEATANFAIDHWDRLSKLPTSVRLKELYGARYAEKDAASNRGTQVHRLAQRLVAGDRVAVPDEIAGHVQSYVRFLDDFDVDPILVETTVWHPEHRYCGTLDLIASLVDPDGDDETARLDWLLDIKTSRSGVFGESALQLAAYRHAEVYLDGDGAEQDMPEVQRTGVVHVGANGYDLVPVEAEAEQFRAFLYSQQIGEFLAGSRDLIGEPIVPPTTSTYRLTRDEATPDE